MPYVCLGLLGVLCLLSCSHAQPPLEPLYVGDQGAFQPQSALSDMEFTSISTYRGPGNNDPRSNKELPILLWWSAGLFPHFPGDTERIDCATSSCLVTRNRKVPELLLNITKHVNLSKTPGFCTMGACMHTS